MHAILCSIQEQLLGYTYYLHKNCNIGLGRKRWGWDFRFETRVGISGIILVVFIHTSLASKRIPETMRFLGKYLHFPKKRMVLNSHNSTNITI